MIKGIYRSASGMVPQVKKQEAIANNIANAGTTGFKQDITFNRELTRAESKLSKDRIDWQTALENRVHVDHAPGVFDKTDNPLDFALDGDGFFTLQSPEGETMLTRSGSFVVDDQGYMAFPGGYRLVGTGGPIQVGQGSPVVGETGEVEVNGVTVGQITAQTVADVSRLERVGGSMFAVPEGEELIAPISSRIQQGYLETSNVDVVREMVDMIVAYRTYEANAKSLQIQDGSLDNLFNRVTGEG